MESIDVLFDCGHNAGLQFSSPFLEEIQNLLFDWTCFATSLASSLRESGSEHLGLFVKGIYRAVVLIDRLGGGWIPDADHLRSLLSATLSLWTHVELESDELDHLGMAMVGILGFNDRIEAQQNKLTAPSVLDVVVEVVAPIAFLKKGVAQISQANDDAALLLRVVTLRALTGGFHTQTAPIFLRPKSSEQPWMNPMAELCMLRGRAAIVITAILKQCFNGFSLSNTHISAGGNGQISVIEQLLKLLGGLLRNASALESVTSLLDVHFFAVIALVSSSLVYPRIADAVKEELDYILDYALPGVIMFRSLRKRLARLFSLWRESISTNCSCTAAQTQCHFSSFLTTETSVQPDALAARFASLSKQLRYYVALSQHCKDHYPCSNVSPFVQTAFVKYIAKTHIRTIVRHLLVILKLRSAEVAICSTAPKAVRSRTGE